MRPFAATKAVGRRWRILAATGICVASLGIAAPANAWCDPHSVDPGRVTTNNVYFDGWQVNGGSNTVGGVYSNIWNYDPYVDPATDYTYAWVMLTQHHSPGVDVPLAQVGWVKWSSGLRKTMVMIHSVGGPYSEAFTDTPKPINTYTYYQVLYNNTPGYVTFWVAGTKVFSWPNWFVPNEAQVYGETHSFRSQMPGGYQSSLYYEDFFNSNYWLGTWRPFAPNAQIFADDKNGVTIPNFGHTNPTTGANLSIWDRACAQ